MKKAPRERIDICKSILQNEKDESLRCEAIWVIGLTATELGTNNPMSDEIADILESVLLNDDSIIVRHEAAFQIGECGMKQKIPSIIKMALNHDSELVRHESVEALGLMKAYECIPTLKKALKDPNEAVSKTAEVVLKQFDRLAKSKQ